MQGKAVNGQAQDYWDMTRKEALDSIPQRGGYAPQMENRRSLRERRVPFPDQRL